LLDRKTAEFLAAEFLCTVAGPARAEEAAIVAMVKAIRKSLIGFIYFVLSD